MARQLMSAEELKSWVLRRLGAPRLTLELHPCHLDDIFEDALDWWSAFKGKEEIHFFNVVAGTAVYDPPEDSDMILDVLPPGPAYDFSIVYSPYVAVDEKVPYDVFAAPEAAGIYSSYAQAIQYSEMAAKVLSADFDWQYDESRRKVILSPIPRRSGLAAMRYKTTCVTVEQLSAHDHELIKRYMLAEAKLILGRIRSRYDDEFLSAEGSKRNDGKLLLEEGRAEREKLDEEIKRSGYPMKFLTG